jgi:hypothetical protein
MKNLKVVSLHGDCIRFENGVSLYSAHNTVCCELHYLSCDDLLLAEFDGLEFDLTGEAFFNRIPDYGIELIPISGFSVKIPGYSHNNGNYSSRLDLIIEDDKGNIKRFDITECQADQV